jgi:NADH:ubiquinone oxidoreductase subunit C
MTQIENHSTKLMEKFAVKIKNTDVSVPNRLKIQIDSVDLLEVMSFIANDLKFPSMEAIAGVDWETHFEVIYWIDRWDGDPTVIQVSVKLNDRENPKIPSITSIWASANWHERELYDLFGIIVTDHPNLKRLLLPEDWDDYEHKHISELYPMRRAYQLPEKPYSFKPHPK